MKIYVLQVVRSMRNACRDIGFFYITNTGIPESLIEKMELQAHTFFDQPLYSKERVSMDKGGKAWRGFFR